MKTATLRRLANQLDAIASELMADGWASTADDLRTHAELFRHASFIPDSVPISAPAADTQERTYHVSNPFYAAALARWKSGEDGEIIAKQLALAFKYIVTEGKGVGYDILEYKRLSDKGKE